jgi:hypothetical protein
MQIDVSMFSHTAAGFRMARNCTTPFDDGSDAAASAEN